MSMKRMVRLLSATSLALTIGLGFTAHAAITVLDYYRLGEDDPGAANGALVTFPRDSVGAKTLTAVGGPFYYSPVSAAASNHVGGSLCVNFYGSTYATNNILSAVTDNFGIEAWVSPNGVGGTGVLAYNGDTGANGWGLFVSGSTYQALFGGQIAFGSGTATASTWTHLAVVRNSGAATFYVNGVAAGTTTTAPSVPIGRFGIAAPPQAPTNQIFNGLVDEVRMFTFAPGQFSTNDLLFNSLLVTKLGDSGPGTLRNAMLLAPSNGIISITATGTIALSGALPLITNSLTILGRGPSNLTISGGGSNRLFFVDAPNGAVNLSGFTLANGRAKGGDGGAGAQGGGGGLGAGGAIFANAGVVTVSNVIFTANSAAGGDGGNAGTTGGGGGGGLGGDGGFGNNSSGGGGGGFGGRGGSVNQDGGGGGGGVIANGGNGDMGGGGGGGALLAGSAASGTTGGAGGPGGGGNGGTGNLGSGNAAGANGQNHGGGGGGGYGAGPYSLPGGNGGNGGKFGGGGGSDENADAGNGGDFGGGGGSSPPDNHLGFSTEGIAGTGGFGGGGGGGGGASGSGNGGFGGGGGGKLCYILAGGGGGTFGGRGASADDCNAATAGAGGGGGAALGGAVFVRGNNGSTLNLVDCGAGSGTLTPGAPGVGGGIHTGYFGDPGQAAGSAVFLLGGSNVFTVSTGQQTMAGSVGGWSGAPVVFIKQGAGTLVLQTANTFSGTTIVNGGTLRINGDNTVCSNLIVNAGGTIAGTGSIALFTLNTGGTLSPGASPGSLTASNTVWTGAGNYNWQVLDAAGAAGAGYDVLAVNGTLDVSGASGFRVNLWSLSATNPDVLRSGIALHQLFMGLLAAGHHLWWRNGVQRGEFRRQYYCYQRHERLFQRAGQWFLPHRARGQQPCVAFLCAGGRRHHSGDRGWLR